MALKKFVKDIIRFTPVLNENPRSLKTMNEEQKKEFYEMLAEEKKDIDETGIRVVDFIYKNFNDSNDEVMLNTKNADLDDVDRIKDLLINVVKMKFGMQDFEKVFELYTLNKNDTLKSLDRLRKEIEKQRRTKAPVEVIINRVGGEYMDTLVRRLHQFHPDTDPWLWREKINLTDEEIQERRKLEEYQKKKEKEEKKKKTQIKRAETIRRKKEEEKQEKDRMGGYGTTANIPNLSSRGIETLFGIIKNKLFSIKRFKKDPQEFLNALDDGYMEAFLDVLDDKEKEQLMKLLPEDFLNKYKMSRRKVKVSEPETEPVDISAYLPQEEKPKKKQKQVKKEILEETKMEAIAEEMKTTIAKRTRRPKKEPKYKKTITLKRSPKVATSTIDDYLEHAELIGKDPKDYTEEDKIKMKKTPFPSSYIDYLNFINKHKTTKPTFNEKMMNLQHLENLKNKKRIKDFSYSIADLDGDGENDIFVINKAGQLIAFNGHVLKNMNDWKLVKEFYENTDVDPGTKAAGLKSMKKQFIDERFNIDADGLTETEKEKILRERSSMIKVPSNMGDVANPKKRDPSFRDIVRDAVVKPLVDVLKAYYDSIGAKPSDSRTYINLYNRLLKYIQEIVDANLDHGITAKNQTALVRAINKYKKDNFKDILRDYVKSILSELEDIIMEYVPEGGDNTVKSALEATVNNIGLEIDAL